MFEAIVLVQNREELRAGAGELLDFGGEASALALPAPAPLLAQVQLTGGQVFLDAPPGSALRVNGQPLHGSRLLQAGDVLTLPGASIECARDGAVLRLLASFAPVPASPADAARAPLIDTDTGAPAARAPLIDRDAQAPAAPTPLKNESAAAQPTPLSNESAAAKRAPLKNGLAAVRALFKNESAAAKPARLKNGRAARGARRPLLVTLLIALPFAALALFTVFGVSVELAITPAPETLRASTSLPRLQLGARVLLLPGTHRLHATRAGYHALELEYEVSRAPGQRVTAQLQPLPGILEISTQPAGAHAVEINDVRSAQKTPLRVELAAGRHRVRVLGGARYLDYVTVVEVLDRGRVQQLAAVLQPNWATVHLRSQPPGAQIFVDDEARGQTPATLQVLAGPHKLRLALAGYRDAHEALTARAQSEIELPVIALRRAPGVLRVRSEPPGARVSAGGEDRGTTPLRLELEPGPQRLQFFAPGYARLAREVTVQSGETRELAVRLEAQYGEVLLRVVPPAALVQVGAEPPAAGDARGETLLRLLARPQQIKISHPGYGDETLTVKPRANERSVVTVQLQTLAALREANRPREIKTHDGQALLLLRPGAKFELGSSRREPERRANEVLFDVELTRPFYLGAHEVSNAAYRRFVSAHNSGTHRAHSLNADAQPVVNITWGDAARYCNWLSEQQGLPLAYPPDKDGNPAPAAARNTGYRLPTEAEWVWAARYHGGARRPAPRYAWGAALPPPAGAGNFADASARQVLVNVMSSYRDAFIVSAPVLRAAANPLGVRGLAGNVAEWMNDGYATPAPGALLRDPRGAPAAGPDAARAIRGASWRHFRARELRSSFRDYGNSARDDLGFRIARDAD